MQASKVGYFRNRIFDTLLGNLRLRTMFVHDKTLQFEGGHST